MTRNQSRFLLTILAGFATFGGSLALATGFAAEDEQPGLSPWHYVEETRDEMRSIAVQACRAGGPEAGDEALSAFRSDYARKAASYEGGVRGRMADGVQRPQGLPVTAPSFESSLERLCPQLRSGGLDIAAEPTPVPFVAPASNVLTWEELDAAAAAAGWPDEPGWWPEMRLIVQCESGRNIFALNSSDPNGGSYGLAQLNGRQHFDKSGENFEMRYDPVVNLRTALWLRTVRGHFGGAGGWKICSERYGIQ